MKKQTRWICKRVFALSLAYFVGSTERSVASDAILGESTRVVSFQGRLTDSNGLPLVGQHDLLFSLYRDADAVSPIWEEVHSNVQLADGRFSVLLGGTTRLDDPDGNPATSDAVDFSIAVYIGTKVDTGMEMRPRKQIVPAIHAFTATACDQAESAATLDGRPRTTLVPPGTIVAYGGAAAPPGWLLCNGEPVSRTTYKELHDAIGEAWGHGDGSTTFNVPDLRGRFLRGQDGGSDRDPNVSTREASGPGGNTGTTPSVVGSVQSGATRLPNVPFGTTTNGAHDHSRPDNPAFNRIMLAPPNQQNPPRTLAAGTPLDFYTNGDEPSLAESAVMANAGAHSHQINSGGDLETRPINAAVNWIIKY